MKRVGKKTEGAPTWYQPAELYRFELWRLPVIVTVPFQGGDGGYTKSVHHTPEKSSFFTVSVLSFVNMRVLRISLCLLQFLPSVFVEGRRPLSSQMNTTETRNVKHPDLPPLQLAFHPEAWEWV